MNEDDAKWEAEKRIQDDYLRSQLAALRNGPGRRWRSFRVLEMRCGNCGDAILEVMSLDPYRVVYVRDSVVRKGSAPAANAPVAEWIEHDRANPPLVRRGAPKFFPIGDDWTPSTRQSIVTACRCRGWTIPSVEVADTLRAGVRRVVRHLK